MNVVKFKLRLFFAIIVLWNCHLAGVAAGELDGSIDQVLGDQRLEGATVAISVVSLKSGKTIYSRNADKPMIPASNQKLITAATALHELGRRYEFTTALWMDGQVGTDGVLNGDLLIEGGGDPTICSWEYKKWAQKGTLSSGGKVNAFQQWAKQLDAKDLRRIRGDVLVDASVFDDQRTPGDWPDGQMWRQYCAPVAGLTYQQGCVRVIVKPGKKVGNPARVRLSPETSGLSVRNTCDTRPHRHAIWFDRDSDSSVIKVGGDVRHGSVGYSGWVTVPDPAMFAGEAFAQKLQNAGIQLEGKVHKMSGKPPGQQWHRVFQRRVSLLDVLHLMLVESINPFAEHVVKTIGAERKGKGTWEAGLKTISASLKTWGASADSFRLADGSGMSRRNRLTTGLICRVLRKMGKGPKGGLFRRLLAEPGEGTLKHRFQRKPYRSRVQAKTGFLRRVGALSGYAKTKKGTDVAFSILINDFTRGSNPDMKQIEDQIVRVIIDTAPE